MNPRCSRQARGVAPNAAAPQQPVRTTKDERVAPGTGVLAKNRLDFGGGAAEPEEPQRLQVRRQRGQVLAPGQRENGNIFKRHRKGFEK